MTEQYLAPRTLEEALEATVSSDATILAGGTDLLPRYDRGLIERPKTVVSLKNVAELCGVSRANGEIAIGTCTPLSEIATNPIIIEGAPALAKAAGRIACPQIRNRATIGGNLCNASPAADTAIPLILYDAVLQMVYLTGKEIRKCDGPIEHFFKGPGSTALKHGEILTRIKFAPIETGVFTAWDKFGTRPAMEIAVASVGVALKREAGRVTHARIGYGSVAPTPLRGLKAEAELLGNPLSPEKIQKCEAAARDEIAPITDVRAGEEYRRDIVGVLLRRMLEEASRG